jgi:hypothetical protein
MLSIYATSAEHCGMRDYSHELIKTEFYEHLNVALSNGISPVLVTGYAGSGKTAVLRLLEHEWSSGGRLAFYIDLQGVLRPSDLVSRLQRRLQQLGIQRTHEPQVVSSSANAALGSAVDLIRTLPSIPLVLLDEIGLTWNDEFILNFVRLISENTNALVVAAGRSPLFESGVTGIFKEVLTISPFTRSELRILLEDELQRLQLNEGEQDQIYALAQASPIIAELVLRNSQLILDLVREKVTSFSLSEWLRGAIDRLGETDRSIILQLLPIIALCGSLSRSEIERFGFSIPESLVSSGLVAVNGDTVSLGHAAFKRVVLSIAEILPDAGTRLRNLQFGAEEAERDGLLSENFIQLPGYRDLVLGETNIVVGDRGSGKSAMFSQLRTSKEPTPHGRSVRVIRLTHPAELLRKLEAKGSELRTAEEFRAGWLALAAYSLAANITTFSSRSQKRKALRIREALNDAVSESFIKRILKRLHLGSSIKITLGPIVLEPAVVASERGLRGAIIDLLGFVREAAVIFNNAGQAVIIALDRIDEIHKYDRALQEKAIQGLFLAESDLAQIPGINFLIFIRSDLFRLYDIQEKNKLVSRTLEIGWNRQDLLEFLVHRVLSNDCLAGLKNFIEKLRVMGNDVAIKAIFPTRIEDTPAVEWLWDCMANGNGHVSPRQIILLLLYATDSPPTRDLEIEGFPLFPEDALRWAMDRLSHLSFEELIDDFRVARTFLLNCRAGKKNSFALTEVSNLFSEADGAIAMQVAQLERLGFLERVLVQNGDGKQSAEFRVPKLFTRGWSSA